MRETRLSPHEPVEAQRARAGIQRIADGGGFAKAAAHLEFVLARDAARMRHALQCLQAPGTGACHQVLVSKICQLSHAAILPGDHESAKPRVVWMANETLQ